jgi:hypothetical protein
VSEISDPHLRDDVLAAYLDRTLSASARAAADAHLAECPTCRDELVAVTALARYTRRRSRAARVGAPLAAVAAAVLIAVFVPWRGPQHTPGVDGERLRKTTGVAGARLRAVAPVDGATLRPDSVRFTWHREAGDAAYHLTVSDESGSVQWTVDTSDSTIGMPASVRLKAGRSYYWYVDAIGGDGKTRATGLSQFRVAP